MKKDEFETAVMHMLIVQQAQLHALRDFAITYICGVSGLDEREKQHVSAQYELKVREGINTVKAQLQAHYFTDFDIDEMLRGLFSKDS